jgi:hypothetical protein
MTTCLHCAINAAIDAHSEREHMSTGEPVSVQGVVDDLLQCAAELIAMHADAKDRKHAIKTSSSKLTAMVRQFRMEGRYPGGPGQTPIGGWVH